MTNLVLHYHLDNDPCIHWTQWISPDSVMAGETIYSRDKHARVTQWSWSRRVTPRTLGGGHWFSWWKWGWFTSITWYCCCRLLLNHPCDSKSDSSGTSAEDLCHLTRWPVAMGVSGRVKVSPQFFPCRNWYLWSSPLEIFPSCCPRWLSQWGRSVALSSARCSSFWGGRIWNSWFSG